MALVVEDGTGLSNSESYASVQDFISYHDARANSYTTDATALAGALRKATDYMESRWSTMWVGERQTFTQALSWPRVGAYYPDDGRPAEGVPIEVKKACMEYALRSLTNELNPDFVYTTTAGNILETEDRVGPIMQRRKYSEGSVTQTTYRKFPTIDDSLRPLLGGGGFLYLARV